MPATTITFGGCCCDSTLCGDVTIPANMVVTFSGLEGDCIYPDEPPCDSPSAPVANQSYTLSRYYFGDNDCDPYGMGDDCVGCYRLGTLHLCDVLALYDLELDATCFTCADWGQTCDADTGSFKFLDTFDCSGNTVDVYLAISCCVTFGETSATATVVVQFIYVSAADTANPVPQLGFGFYGSQFYYPGSPSGCSISTGIATSCNITGPVNNSDPGGIPDGLALLTLGGPPDYSGSDTGSCCGTLTTLTLEAM